MHGSWRIELRRQQDGEADRAGAHDGDRVSGLHLTVQHAALEAGRQDVAQHDERFFVAVRGKVVETHVGMRDAHELRLRAVDGVAEDPAPVAAVRVHAFPAVVALPAGRDTGDDHPIAWMNGRDRRAHLRHDADALVPENPARRHTRQVALQDVQVGTADGGGGDPDDGVGRVLDRRAGRLFPGALARTVIDQRLHATCRGALGLRRRGFGGYSHDSTP